MQDLPKQGLELKTNLSGPVQGQQCSMTERWRPEGDSVCWDVEILGTEIPWSTTIELAVGYPAGGKTLHWLAWDSPPTDQAAMSADGAKPLGMRVKPVGAGGWTDPLLACPLRTKRYSYGAPRFRVERQDVGWYGWWYRPDGQNFCSMPIVTLIEPGQSGLSLVASPEPMQLDMEVLVDASGMVRFRWDRLRISKRSPIRLTMHLVRHEPDWRGGLRWMVGRYPAYFDPPNPAVQELAGT